MKQVFVANSLWGVIVGSSFTSKLILIIGSAALIWCLFIFIFKLLVLREKYQEVLQARKSLDSVKSLEGILALGTLVRGTIAGDVLGRGLQSLKELLHTPEGTMKKLSQKDFELLEGSLDQALQDVMHDEHEQLPILSVSAAVAPLVGLFGTISGLIQSFIAIGQEKSADIAAIAPGIAEALLTTFAGLVVAIPALIMYHYLHSRIHNLEHQLVSLTHRFEWVIKTVLLEK